MMQRYRAILHLVDPLIEAGHEVKMVVSDKEVDLKGFRKRPCDASASAPNTVAYIAAAIGLKVKHLDKVKYTRTKNPVCDQYLGYDSSQSNAFGIPYVGSGTHWKGLYAHTGNPMEDLVTDDYRPNTVLILHPGGGRGYVSPIRRDYDKGKTSRNNVVFIQSILDSLPQTISKVTIKTHPVPGVRCTKRALEKFVAPQLSRPVYIEDMSLIRHINEHEYILNFGGTSALWVINSGKKWANVTGLVKYPESKQRERLLSSRGGGTPIEKLSGWFDRRAPQAKKKPNAIPRILREMHESFGL